MIPVASATVESRASADIQLSLTRQQSWAFVHRGLKHHGYTQTTANAVKTIVRENAE